MSLTGSGCGASRDAIILSAREAAATYYGTGCLSIGLSNEQSIQMNVGILSDPSKTYQTGFSASWVADIKHQWRRPSYGPVECDVCKLKDWNHK